MLTNGRRDLNDIGRYRTHTDPMQIVSGALYAPKVHFEAPPSSQMMAEMEQFITWFNDTAPIWEKSAARFVTCGHWPTSILSVSTLSKTANGRIGRALAEKALAQCVGQPTLIAIAYTIERNKKSLLHRP